MSPDVFRCDNDIMIMVLKQSHYPLELPAEILMDEMIQCLGFTLINIIQCLEAGMTDEKGYVLGTEVG